MRVLCFLFLIAGSAAAQQPARGTFEYQVDGFYEGDAMEPWSATTTVFDTASTPAIRHVVHRGGGTRFEYLYIAGKSASWINQGRSATANCSATSTTEVPDFALFHVIAGMPPGEHELTMLVCAGAGEVKGRVVRFTIVPADAGWTAKGSNDYAFEMTIDAQRRVLKYVQPQGSVGIAIYTLR